MAGVLDAYRAEVDGQDIECGVRRTLENARQASYERVGTIGCHGINHHTAGTRAAERFHQCCRHGVNPLGINSRQLHAPAHTANEHVHGSAGTEYADADEDSNQIGYDADSGGETVLGTFDESVVDVYLFAYTC